MLSIRYIYLIQKIRKLEEKSPLRYFNSLGERFLKTQNIAQYNTPKWNSFEVKLRKDVKREIFEILSN